MTAVYLFALLTGIGCWLPAPSETRRDWIGFLFLQSWLLLIVLLYVGDVLLGIALSHLWIVLAIFAGLGIAFRLYRMNLSRTEIAARAIHPIWILMILVSAVTYANGGIEYLPFPGDETGSWLLYARQIFLVDSYWSDAVVYHHGGYTNGWPMLIAFANVIHGEYNDAHGVAVPFVMQLGVMGATFDVVRHICRQEGLRVDDKITTVLAWLAVLVLLAVEASWVLLPIFQLSDEPLIFALIGCLLISLIGLYSAANRDVIALYLGLAFAAAYLLKLTALTFAPAAVVILLGFLYFDRRDGNPRDRTLVVSIAILTCAIFGPLVVASGTWSFLKPMAECNASPLAMLTQETGAAYRQPLAVAAGFSVDVAKFFGAYKLPLSIAGALFLAAGLIHGRARWLVIAFAGFASAYTFALYVAYMTCIDVVSLGNFEALPRYMRTVIRLVHFLGPIVLLMVVLGIARSNTAIRNLVAHKAMQATMLLAVVALLGWQVRSVDRSIDDMRTRDYQNPVLKTTILTVKAQAESLIAIIARRGLQRPRVSLIAQDGYAVELDLAQYFGIKSRRDGGSNFFYVPEPPFFWSAQASSIFASPMSADALEKHWRGFDIIWPYRTDEWTRGVLGRLITDQACRAEPERFFLLKSGSGGFECVAKAG